jgi:hypothetical protein
MRDTPSVQPPAEAAHREPMPAGRALYTQNYAEIKKCCGRRELKSIGGLPRPDYGRRMMRAGKILFLLALGGLTARPALAQDPYALTAIKPYDAPVAAPPANGLATVIRSEKPGTDAAGKPKPAGEPLFTIHAFGGVEVGGAMR